ncbi:hypothetical protein RUE5091_02716 [Ruegeria denitrificans]|uniref:Uncharacterized protein n=1 Tax=Ruegeria denitrificans TaxID=1715692 RepID=A0A0P1ICN9_9RHOB|nr:hypothetical protein [Ruegeria denitrificans]CUK05426.1 hypothetical protein RUE5091_02716 [Ruegeria denitrificans]
MHKFLTATAATVLTLGLSVGLAQAETYDAAAKGTGVNANQVYGISDGNAVVKTQTDYDSFEVAAGHPLEGATGTCFGAVLVNGAAVSGTGNCVFDTTSGEKAVMTWTATGLGADGALTGEWTVSGGSGNWASATGGGTFSSLTDPDTKKFVNTISGSFTIE